MLDTKEIDIQNGNLAPAFKCIYLARQEKKICKAHARDMHGKKQVTDAVFGTFQTSFTPTFILLKILPAYFYYFGTGNLGVLARN